MSEKETRLEKVKREGFESKWFLALSDRQWKSDLDGKTYHFFSPTTVSIETNGMIKDDKYRIVCDAEANCTLAIGDKEYTLDSIIRENDPWRLTIIDHLKEP